MNYDTTEIRRFLFESYSDEELTTFCYDYFRDVHSDFSGTMPKGSKIQRLIEYCARREVIPNLLAAFQRDRPEQYEKYRDRFSKEATAPTRSKPSKPKHNPKQMFISYAHQDTDLAHQLKTDLQGSGWEVWIAPESIQAGEKWGEAIERGLYESGTFIVVLTPAAVTSTWVRNETYVAIEFEIQGYLRFIALDVEPCDVPPLWNIYQHVSFLNNYRTGLQALLNALKQPKRFHTSQTALPKPSVAPVKLELATFIDLPGNFQPLAFLRDVEDSLTGRSRVVVNLCKEAWKCDDQIFVDKITQDAERLWRKHREQLGAVVAFLWLADRCWRNGQPESIFRYCDEVLEHVPVRPAPTYMIGYTVTKAVTHYMLGLAHQMTGQNSKAFDSYQEALELFEASNYYWQRVSNNELVEISDEILEWIKRLIEYVGDPRLHPSGSMSSPIKLICPWRSSVQGKYILAELTLVKAITEHEVRKETSNFLLQRNQPWRSVESVKIDGYKVESSLRVLGLDDSITQITLRGLNPDAMCDDDLVLPVGVLYHLIQVDDQLALPNADINQGDYLLACSATIFNPNLLALFRRKGGRDMILGSFERDRFGRFRQKSPSSMHIVGRVESSLDFFGNVDFVLRKLGPA